MKCIVLYNSCDKERFENIRNGTHCLIVSFGAYVVMIIVA